MTAPTRYALVPEDPTPDMIRAIETQNLAGYAADAWDNAIAASPNAGKITAEMLRAIVLNFQIERDKGSLTEDAMRLALQRSGLTVADAPAGEVVDG
jgi:hypothetical protein